MSSALRFETAAVLMAVLCNIMYMQKGAAQQDARAQRSVLRGTAGKVSLMR